MSSVQPAEAAAPGKVVKRRSGPRSRTSPYKGVTQYRRTGKWEAHIWIPNPRGRGFQRHLGSYHTAEDAARCFDRATIRVRGPQEELNFPLEEYSRDAFMLEHSKTDRMKFLDLMRAQFAITTEPINPKKRVAEMRQAAAAGSPKVQVGGRDGFPGGMAARKITNDLRTPILFTSPTKQQQEQHWMSPVSPPTGSSLFPAASPAGASSGTPRPALSFAAAIGLETLPSPCSGVNQLSPSWAGLPPAYNGGNLCSPLLLQNSGVGVGSATTGILAVGQGSSYTTLMPPASRLDGISGPSTSGLSAGLGHFGGVLNQDGTTNIGDQDLFYFGDGTINLNMNTLGGEGDQHYTHTMNLDDSTFDVNGWD